MVEIDRFDLADVGVSDQVELQSDYTGFYKSVTLADTTSGTATIVVSTVSDNLLHADNPVESGDTVVIAGNAAAGTYTIDVMISDTQFTVVESLPDSTGGTSSFRYPPGAQKVGFYVAPLSFTSDAPNVQKVMEAMDGYKLAEESLSLAINYVQNGFEEITYSGTKATNITLWETASKLIKVRESQLTYDGNNVSQVIDIQYDALGIEKYRLTQTYVYTGNMIISSTQTRTDV